MLLDPSGSPLPLPLQLPSYQPTPGARTPYTLQNGDFCYSKQPDWSAFRQPSFGHGELSRAYWQRPGDSRKQVKIDIARPEKLTASASPSAACTRSCSWLRCVPTRRHRPHPCCLPPPAGILDIQSPTTARWRWHRNSEGFAVVGEQCGHVPSMLCNRNL